MSNNKQQTAVESIIETIKKNLNDERMFNLLLHKIEYQINNPDPNYGIISPMYSLMPCFFDYYNVEELTNEQMQYADKVIKIVDDAFGGGYRELSYKITIEQDFKTDNLIKDLKHTKNVLEVLKTNITNK